jgi:hypothetical protein
MCCPGNLECENCRDPGGILFGTISELPEILICQVARFGKRWFGLGKVHKIVSFTDQNLDMSHFVAPGIDCGPSVYELVAVVSHSGTLSSGHYVCYAQNKRRWFLFNDSVVTDAPRDEVLASQAYLLFYTKVTPPNVRELRERIGPEVGLPIHVCSDPRQWRESIPEGGDDGLFAAAEQLAGGKVTRPVNDEDLRRRFVRELGISRCSMSINATACEQIRTFLSVKNSPVPVIFNLHEENGIPVGEAVQMFYRDPETFGVPAEDAAVEEPGEAAQDAHAEGSGDAVSESVQDAHAEGSGEDEVAEGGEAVEDAGAV